MRFVPRFRDSTAVAASEGRTETLVEEGTWPGQVVEEEVGGPPPPPPPPRGPLIWPWLLLLLLLVAAGLIALWLVQRDDHKGSNTVVVPNVIGERQGQAVQRLEGARLASRVVAKLNTAPPGTVFAEEPGPGSHITRGSVVKISVSSAAQLRAPDVVGDKAPAAVRALHARGLSVETASVRSSKPAGVVLSQNPAAGAAVAKGSTVLIRVSRGAVRVPSLIGQSRSSAVAALRAAGLVPNVFKVPSAQPSGTVVAQQPSGGVSVPRGSNVRLNLSKGSGSGVAPPPPPPAPIGGSVPDLTGEVQSAAQRELNADGFRARVVYVSSDQPAGLVVSQAPSGGATARKGTRIRLDASLGPTPGTRKGIPKVIGLDPQTAAERLSSAGFRVQRLTQSTTVSSQDGLIVDVQPGGSIRVPVGSTVTIYVGRFSG